MGSLLGRLIRYAGGEMRGIEMKRIRGENMRLEYYVLGAVALMVVAAGVTMLPDFIRYMKIRSM
jgi:hypothetical protein